MSMSTHPTPEIAVVLVNLGTPDAPTPRAVRRYLAEFLMDPRVVSLPRWLWGPLLRLVGRLLVRVPQPVRDGAGRFAATAATAATLIPAATCGEHECSRGSDGDDG